MSAADLIALAERVEKAEGPSGLRREAELEALFLDAFMAMPRQEEHHWQRADWNRFRLLCLHGAWLDAAMTLVPDGANIVVCHENGMASASVPLAGIRNSPVVFAATAALALTAAALRARAAQEGDA